jgi:hypothetical protein
VVAKYNQDHGIELPGAVFLEGVKMDTILWEDEIARRNSVSDPTGKVRRNPSSPAD